MSCPLVRFECDSIAQGLTGVGRMFPFCKYNLSVSISAKHSTGIQEELIEEKGMAQAEFTSSKRPARCTCTAQICPGLKFGVWHSIFDGRRVFLICIHEYVVSSKQCTASYMV